MPCTPDALCLRALTPRHRGAVRGLILGLALAAGLAASQGTLASGGVQASAAAGPVQARRMLRGPTLIALLPPAARAQGDAGAQEAVAHVHFALTEARRCLGGKAVRFEVVYADRLTLVVRGKGEPLAAGEQGDGIAMVLAEPDRPPLLVQSVVGPSALQHQLPQAAFDYWRVQACNRE